MILKKNQSIGKAFKKWLKALNRRLKFEKENPGIHMELDEYLDACRDFGRTLRSNHYSAYQWHKIIEYLENDIDI